VSEEIGFLDKLFGRQ
jgi:hypothetical protein